MIQNLRMRWKLVALLAAPLLGLLGFAALHAWERLQVIGEARTAEDLAATAHTLDRVLAELQAERRDSEGAFTSPAGQVPAYEVINQAREATDEAFDTVLADDEVIAPVGDRVRADRELLEEVRERLDAGASVRTDVQEAYRPVVEAVIATQRFVGIDRAGLDLDRLDAELARDLQGLVALSVASEATARELLAVERVLRAGGDVGAVRYAAEAARARSAEEDARAVLRPPLEAELDGLLDTREAARSDTLRDRVLIGGRVDTDILSFASANDLDARLDALRVAASQTAAEVQGAASVEAELANREGIIATGVAGGIVVVALLLSLLITRSTERPIRELAAAAEDVSERQLPEMVAALNAARPVSPELTEPIDANVGDDEIGTLARSFERVRHVAADTTVELADTARRGVSELFVNLARRNQSLVDRQLRLLDRLERHEEDPEALERLFTLDHLATRMRRNAESLLVMAGAESSRRPSRPLPLSEVLQAAAGEVEDYPRVEVRSTVTTDVEGRAAPDLAHLLAELVENATSYSDPSTTVDVTADLDPDSEGGAPGAVIQVRDRGVGMNADALRHANERLREPPSAGFGVGRSLGFVVAGLLAQRHDVEVTLSSAADGVGTVATVRVPPALLAVDVEPSDGPTDADSDDGNDVAAVAERRDDPPGPVGAMEVHGDALLPGMALGPAPAPARGPTAPDESSADAAPEAAGTAPAGPTKAAPAPSTAVATEPASATSAPAGTDVVDDDVPSAEEVRARRLWRGRRKSDGGSRGRRSQPAPQGWSIPAPGAAPGIGATARAGGPGSGADDRRGHPSAPGWSDEERAVPLEDALEQREARDGESAGEEAPPLPRRDTHPSNAPAAESPSSPPSDAGAESLPRRHDPAVRRDDLSPPASAEAIGDDDVPRDRRELPRRRPGQAAPPTEPSGQGLLSQAEESDEDPRDTLSRYLSGIARARQPDEHDDGGEGS